MKANKQLTLSKTGLDIITLLLTLKCADAKAQQTNQSDTNVVARLIRYEVKPESP